MAAASTTTIRNKVSYAGGRSLLAELKPPKEGEDHCEESALMTSFPDRCGPARWERCTVTAVNLNPAVWVLQDHNGLVQKDSRRHGVQRRTS
jgi:hypothetical protein